MCKWPAGGAKRVPSDVGRGAQGQAQGGVQTHGGEFSVVLTDFLTLRLIFCIPTPGKKRKFHPE